MSAEIDALLAEINHPLSAQVEELRKLILAADPSIEEGIKWNSLSFRTHEWFATFNKRAMDRVEFVFHLGAKVRNDAEVTSIPDPAGLLNWRGKDRAIITFKDTEAVEQKKAAFADVVKAWVKHV